MKQILFLLLASFAIVGCEKPQAKPTPQISFYSAHEPGGPYEVWHAVVKIPQPVNKDLNYEVKWSMGISKGGWDVTSPISVPAGVVEVDQNTEMLVLPDKHKIVAVQIIPIEKGL